MTDSSGPGPETNEDLTTPTEQGRHRTYKRVAIAVTIPVLAAAVIYTCINPGWPAAMGSYLRSEISPAVFFILFLFLPIAGAPATLFLVSIGLTFDPVTGFLMVLIAFPFHLFVAVRLARSFLKERVIAYISRKYDTKLEIRQDRMKGITFLYFAVPHLPYSIKNVLFGLTNVPTSTVLCYGCPANIIMALPAVFAGQRVADSDWFIAIVVVALMIIAGALLRPLKSMLFADRKG